jgi:hypothetical protein
MKLEAPAAAAATLWGEGGHRGLRPTSKVNTFIKKNIFKLRKNMKKSKNKLPCLFAIF